MEIKEFIEKAHENAVKKGFWDKWNRSIGTWDFWQPDFPNEVKWERNNAIGTMLMLIVSELGEALEALRKDDIENFKEELADVAIRLADMCGGLEIDLETEIHKKMEKNTQRPRLHGKEF